jgi:branched-chain amino acid transport system ATP-binding protein
MNPHAAPTRQRRRPNRRDAGPSDLAAAGMTIVLVEQNLAATLTLAQRVYIINNGHIVHEGPAHEIKAQPQILQRYLGL